MYDNIIIYIDKDKTPVRTKERTKKFICFTFRIVKVMGDSAAYTNSTATSAAEGAVVQSRNHKTVIRIQGK